MEKISKELSYEIWSVNELPESAQKLLERAHANASKAYAPYSHFYVGAALELSDGRVVDGNNQENAAYPSGLCAERVALFAAGAQFPEQGGKQLAIVAHTAEGPLAEPAAPCGACLQSLSEYELRFEEPITIWLGGKDKVWCFKGVRQLLPFGFDGSLLP
ncbi:MAG: cytidine deaminase [Bacteroidetes bacterium]|nr:MAG: cytidine deaminase [Bacteroidota bacterium]